MGQSNSRLRRNRALSSSSTTQIRSPPLDNEPSQPTTDQNDSQQTLRPHPRAIRFRPAIRRSVMGLVSRSSSDSLAPPAPPKERATKAHFLRKRWRSARRLSKATSTSHLPHSSADTHQDISPIDPPPDHSHREDISLSESGPSSSSTLLRASRPSTPFPLSLSRPPTPRIDVPPDDEALSEEERRLSQNIGTWLSGSGPSSSSVAPHDGSSLTTPVTQDVPLEREPSEYLSAHSHPNSEYTPPHSPTDTSASNPPPPPVPTEQPPQPQPQLQPRHFPPPGTLVVVQGVVNTTDAPPAPTPSRPHHSSAPRPPTDPALLAPPPSRHRRSASAPRSMNRSNNLAEERSAARTGLSSLLPRPNSMITRRPSTESASSNTQASSSQDLLSSEASTSAPSSVTTPEASSSHINEQRDVSSNETSDAHRPLSPGSIDVLGTLLSVAAAATAASLFSPTFAPNTTANSGAASRPLSPTPTAGLGGLGGLDGLAGLNLDPTGERPSQQPGSSQNDRDARDRIRNVWDTIRERMGFSSRNPGSAGQPGTLAIPEGQGTEGDGAAARMRPGELMLAEMARALNAGLGLAGRSDRQGSENPAPEAANSDEDTRPPAPEAGFERFLLNLQADLRAVLSEDVPAHNEDTSTQAQAANPEPLQPVTSVLESSAPPSPSDVPLQSAGLDSDFDDEDTISPVTERREGVSSRSRPPHPRTATPIPTPTIPHIVEPIDRDNQNTRATVDRRRPAVNLWRIYRFQPIPAPPSQNQAQAQSTSASPVTAESLLHGSSTVPPESLPGSTTTTMATGNNAGTDAMPPAAAVAPQPVADLNVVVPVIVVGLQSVDTALGRAQANGDEPTLPNDDLQEAAADAGIQEDIFAAQDPLNGNSHMPSTPRGRSWPSRAANALRTLRPGRRTGSRGRNSNEGPGSRTFLIYVIGGYYPPHHHMVTGADSLDTYEALWELAELLGQVKPPVATKEDIDNSGLQIIKATDMKQYEEEGRIASNCTDRCLVCLDDYSDDDNIRVMTCKHAFHKDCVDKWLQVGRNNCPACRTQGVTNSPSSTTPLAS